MYCLDMNKSCSTSFLIDLLRAARQARCYLWVVSHGGERAQWGHNKVISVWRAGAPGIPGWRKDGGMGRAGAVGPS